MTKNQKLILLVLISMMGCGLGSITPAQAATTITSVNDLQDKQTVHFGASFNDYDVYAPKTELGTDVTLDLQSFSPTRPASTNLFGVYTKDTDAAPVTGVHFTVTSTGTADSLQNIAGAYSENGDVGSYTEGVTTEPSNITIVTGGTASDMAGGISEKGNALNNELDISGSAQPGSAYGGRSTAGDASYNVLKVDLPDATKGMGLYGGSTSQGNASYNKVEITTGNADSLVYGGYASGSGNVNNNQVIIHDGVFSTVDGGYNGGSGENDTADGNTIVMEKGTIKDDITGGYTFKGTSACNNIVTLGDVTLYGTIAAGNASYGEKASNNKIELTGGTADTPFTYTPRMMVVGLSNGVSDENKLIIGKNSILDTTSSYIIVTEGTSQTNNNSVDLQGTLASGENVYIGYVLGDNGVAKENTFTSTGGTIGNGTNIYISLAPKTNAMASGNIGTLNKGTTVGAGVTIEVAEGVTVDSNIMNINDGVTFTSGNDINIAAGYGYSSATNNIVNLNGTVVGDGLCLYGGMAPTSTGNTLNVKSLNNEVKEIGYFQNLNFYIPKEAVNGSTMLTITSGEPTDLTGATIKAGASDATILNVGDKINLIVNEAGVTTDEDSESATATKYGVLTDAGFAQTGVEVKKDGEDKIIATITKLAPKPPDPEPEPNPDPKPNPNPNPEPNPEPNPKPEPAASLHPGTKSLVEGKVDGLAGLKHNVQFVATDGVQSTMAAAHANAIANGGGPHGPGPGGPQGPGLGGPHDPGKDGKGSSGSNGASAMKLNMDAMARFTPYAVMGAESLKHKTGSYVRSHGFNVNVGLVRRLQREDYIDTIMPFIEYGKGNYSTFLDSGARGDGEHQYLGGGILVRRDRNDGLYYEGSLHGGHIKGDYTGIIDGTRAAYNSSSPYIAMHAGIGKVLPLQKNTSLDVYAKLFWTHEGSDTVTLRSSRGLAQYHFDSMDSVATRLGARWNRTVRKHQKLYIGTGWEYEFNGDGIASYNGLRTQSPSLQGSSGFLEAGWATEATKDNPYTLDFHVTGWTGLQKGITLAARFNYQF